MRAFRLSSLSISALVSGLWLCAIGCSDSASSKRVGSNTGIAAPESIATDSLAIIIVNELYTDLNNRTSLNADQARKVSISAAQALQIEKIELTLQAGTEAQDYEHNIEDFIDEIIAGSLDALDQIGVVHQRQLNHVLEEIVNSIMRSLEGRTSHLEDEALTGMLASISESAIVSLEKAGYGIKALAEGARIITASSIGGLDDSGTLTEERARGILVAIVSGAIRGLIETPLKNESDRVAAFSFVLDDLMYGAVGSLDDAGFEVEAIDDAIEHTIFACISNLDELKFTAVEYELLVEACIHGALDALKREAGVNQAEQIETALSFCVEGAVEGLGHTSLTVGELDEIVGLIVRKSIEHFDNIGIPKGDSISAVEAILNRTILGLMLAGYEKNHIEEFGDVIGDAILASIEGLAEVGLDDAAIEALLDETILACIKPLKDHEFSKAESTVIMNHFKSTLSSGLAQSTVTGIAYNETTISAHITEALNEVYGP